MSAGNAAYSPAIPGSLLHLQVFGHLFTCGELAAKTTINGLPGEFAR
jgi:hypothetical protein